MKREVTEGFYRHGLGRLALGLGTGLAVGPVIGGALVEAFGWRSVFLYRAPVAGLLAVIASATLPRGRRAGAWRLPPRAEWLRWPVLSGLALAALSTIGLATIAAWIGAGSLGQILRDGISRDPTYSRLYAGVIAIGAIAIMTDIVFRLAERMTNVPGR